ncbi:MAG: hypothetical protein PHC34_04315 [Candidatus Gastranaerophilales bacterium]|nr:hypothetical protein [Candidatus Gastranaerophilales bacterium]
MKITAGHLGALAFAIQTSFQDLDIEMVLPPLSNSQAQELGEKNLKSDLCYPLKLYLGNYLTQKDLKPEIVIFYNGCDLCNLTPAGKVFLDIFAEYSWHPEAYYFNVTDKKQFIKDYYWNLKKISGASSIKVIRAILLGYKKFLLFEYLDNVFYTIRPTIKDNKKGEKIYLEFFQKLTDASSFSSYKKIKKDINSLLESYPPNYNVPHIGLIGDPFTLNEPYIHQYTDRKLGYLGCITDRWINNRFINKKDSEKIKLKNFLKNEYGVLMPREIEKASHYAGKSYDGIVFISPFTCNPSDALRNQLSYIQKKTGIPVISLVFDAHTSDTGLESRLEAFVDLVKIRRNKKQGSDRIVADKNQKFLNCHPSEVKSKDLSN